MNVDVALRLSTLTQEGDMMAACGLLCGPCSIRQIPFETEEARKAINWFKEMGWLDQKEGISEAIAKGMYCKGCHGARTTHWSADCWILECCIDEKGLEHCDECDGFPCDNLVDWSKQNEDYSTALERLKELHSQRDAD